MQIGVRNEKLEYEFGEGTFFKSTLHSFHQEKTNIIGCK